MKIVRFLVVQLFSQFAIAFAQEPAVTVRFLTLNDIYQYEPNSNNTGGMANVATIINNLRVEPSFFSVSGDFVGGSQWGEFEGKPMIEIFNSIQTDMVVIGNHEFDYGADVTLQRMDESQFVWLGANILDINTGEPFGPTVDVYTETIDTNNGGQVTIGFFGVCVEEKDEVSRPGPGVVFSESIQASKDAVEKLEGMGAQVIVAVTHLDIETDIKLAEEIPEIAVILGGHEHEPLVQIVGNTLILKCGQNAELVGVVDLAIFVENVNNEEQVTFSHTWKHEANDQDSPDAEVEAIVSHYREIIDEIAANLNFDEVLTHVIDEPLSTNKIFVRTSPSALGTAAGDSFADFYNISPALGMYNGGAIRAETEYAVGTNITRTIIYDELRFEDSLMRLHIEGRYIKEAVEQLLMLLPEDSGGFPQLSGDFHVMYDFGGDAGTARVRSMSLGEEPLVEDHVYSLVTTTWLAGGGDGASALTNGVVFEHLGTDLREVVSLYLKMTKSAGLSGISPTDILVEVSLPTEVPDCPEAENGLVLIGDSCSTIGEVCLYGQETCCGETHPSVFCDCVDVGGNVGEFICGFTDACLARDCDCCQAADDEDERSNRVCPNIIAKKVCDGRSECEWECGSTPGQGVLCCMGTHDACKNIRAERPCNNREECNWAEHIDCA